MSKPPIFLDTGYFVALLNRRDALHERAVALTTSWLKRPRRALTSDAVLIELGNFFARSPLRMNAIAAIRKLHTSRSIEVESVSAPLLERGETRYAAHPDKGWSLTDCISMELMSARDCREVATPDHHFKQAGFEILLR